MRWLLLPLPSLLPVLIDWAYEPINRNWTAEMFGCGCPPIDGSWRLNANHVNALLWLVILTFCVGAHCRIAWERFGRWRGPLVAGGVPVLAIVCLRMYAGGYWF